MSEGGFGAFTDTFEDLGALTRLRLVANEVDAVEPPQDLPPLPTARVVWEPRLDQRTAAESWLLAGGPHHTCYTQAVSMEAIEDFAEMVGIELLTIDAETDGRAFRSALRWSQAYWHSCRRPLSSMGNRAPGLSKIG